MQATSGSRSLGWVGRGGVCPHRAVNLQGNKLTSDSKSQLAIQFSYLLRKDDPGIFVFWVHGSNRARFEEGYGEIGRELRLPELYDSKMDNLRAIKRWLCDDTNGTWVMIVDNADDIDTFEEPLESSENSARADDVLSPLRSFLPQTANGRIVFTSRCEDVAVQLTRCRRNIISVGPMSPAEGLALCRKKLEIEHDDRQMLNLVQSLDFIPLAISQALAFINERGPRGSISKYLKLFGESDGSRANLLKRDAGDIPRYDGESRSIIKTWEVSFNQIRKERLSAAELLSTMSFYDRQGIPDFLLRSHTVQVSANDNNTQEDFEDDITKLRSYHLISANDSGEVFCMHRLVQFATRSWLERTKHLQVARKRSLGLLSEHFPRPACDNWDICQLLLPHAETAASSGVADNESEILEEWVEILVRAAQYANDVGKYRVGQFMAQEANKASELYLGSGHIKTLSSKKSLIKSCLYERRWEVGKALSIQLVEAERQIFGEQHQDTLESMTDLMFFNVRLGQLKEAEELSHHVMETAQRIPGNNRSLILACIDNLTSIYNKSKQYDKMVKLGLEASRIIGSLPLYPETSERISRGINQYFYLERYNEAWELGQQALEMKRRISRMMGPDNLKFTGLIALMYIKARLLTEAEQLVRRAAEFGEQVLGNEHPEVLRMKQKMTSIYEEKERFEFVLDLRRPDSAVSFIQVGGALKPYWDLLHYN